MNDLIAVEKIAQVAEIEGDGARQRILPIMKRVYSMALGEFMGWSSRSRGPVSPKRP